MNTFYVSPVSALRGLTVFQISLFQLIFTGFSGSQRVSNLGLNNRQLSKVLKFNSRQQSKLVKN